MLDAVKLTVDMIQRRDDMRLLLGPHYLKRATEAREVIRWVAKDEGVTLIIAALRISERIGRANQDPSIVIAALVDELEGAQAGGAG